MRQIILREILMSNPGRTCEYFNPIMPNELILFFALHKFHGVIQVGTHPAYSVYDNACLIEIIFGPILYLSVFFSLV